MARLARARIVSFCNRAPHPRTSSSRYPPKGPSHVSCIVRYIASASPRIAPVLPMGWEARYLILEASDPRTIPWVTEAAMRAWIVVLLPWLGMAARPHSRRTGLRLSSATTTDNTSTSCKRPRPMRRLMRRFCARSGSRFRRAMTSCLSTSGAPGNPAPLSGPERLPEPLIK